MSFKETLESIQPLTVILSSVAVPLIIAYFGNSIATANKNSENRVKYVELAVSILKVEPKSESRALREWAVELLDDQAPAKLSAVARAQLLDRALLGGTATLDSVSASGTINGTPTK